ncbi:MAG: Gfo/Idh/MocA family oxidoreductase [Spirochaetales bacterium]|nr:Gfo/Idh/MocA family oxidoreductase [Spirochaetales bacterium]
MDTVKFGIIGLGLMGREFASAAMRWSHLPDMDVKPEIISICDKNLSSDMESWYRDGLGTVKQATTDYKELLANPEVEAVYCAVPHNLHAQFYVDIIQSGKHLMGEKPFGIDIKANQSIMDAIKAEKNVFVRCSSEFPFTPAMQKLGQLIEEAAFGEIIEVEAGFLHSSDLDTSKPINWKRIIKFNGEYGVLGDLGMHPLHFPLRAGWKPVNVRAILSNLVKERPDGKGGMAPCETWDNATLFCQTKDIEGNSFPMTIKTQRISPGEKNTWYLRIKGMKSSAYFTTKKINTLAVVKFEGKEQIYQEMEMGHHMTFKSITGGIFEAGFSDLIMQMWAAFMYDLTNGKPTPKFSGCVTP